MKSLTLFKASASAIFLSLVSLLLLVAPSCQNRGDIGVLYGQWTVDDVSLDGVRDDAYPYGEVYFRFQTSIVNIDRQLPDHQSAGTWVGTWTRTDTTITFDFDQYQATPPSKPLGSLPGWMHIPAQTSTTFLIEKETGRAFIFSYVDASGQTVCYTLRKLI